MALLVENTCMTLRELDIKPAYDSGAEGSDPLREFLEPCLENSTSYDRLSGYFSSRVLAMAARGLGEFLASDGIMRLVMSSQVTPSDFENLQRVYATGESFDDLFNGYEFDSGAITDLIEKNHFEAMCWLLAQKRLEIKIVIHRDEGERIYTPIFHTKIGIFTDSNNDKVSFSGSVNETVAGWSGNIEEFKVFKSWEDATKSYVELDTQTFYRYWENEAGDSFETINLPDALKRNLVTQAPPDMPDIRSEAKKLSKSVKLSSLRNYQKDAINSWIQSDMSGILEMATGTGKTKTAKGCIEAVIKKGSACILVTAPYEHIAKQWTNELSDLANTVLILASGSNKWEQQVRSSLTSKNLQRINNLIVIAVQNTAASQKFIDLLKEASCSFDQTLIIGDEVHRLGAPSLKKAMQDYYKFRLGLSATPHRYFDEVGSEEILKYFGDSVYSFPTSDALKWRDPITGARALSPYKYFPIFVSLNDRELEEYDKLSIAIGKASGSKSDSDQESVYEQLLFKRASIIKTAEEKVPALEKILQPIAESLQYCLLYCHDFEQLLSVANLLEELGVSYEKITGEESNKADVKYGGLSERDWILQNFSKGTTKILLAIKCLDEGVDIPAARVGFILASSGNPREFIQRRGRMLRPSPNKEFASVYDFVVAPSLHGTDHRKAEQVIFRKELARIDEFAGDAMNTDDVKILTGELLAKSN